MENERDMDITERDEAWKFAANCKGCEKDLFDYLKDGIWYRHEWEDVDGHPLCDECREEKNYVRKK